MTKRGKQQVVPRINTQQGLIITSNDVNKDLTAALSSLHKRNARKAAAAPPNSRSTAAHQRATTLLSLKNLNCAPTALLDVLCDLSTCDIRQACGDIRERLSRYTRTKVLLSAVTLIWLRHDAKFILYTLWSQAKLILPITFCLNKSIPRNERLLISPELIRFCLTFPSKDAKGSTQFRMTQHVPRWLGSTNWRRPEDISIYEAIELNNFMSKCCERRAGFNAPALATSVRLFLSECSRAFPTRVRFNETDLQKFDLYFATRTSVDLPRHDIERTISSIMELRKNSHGIKRPRRNDSRKQKTRKADGNTTDDSVNHFDAERLVYKQRYSRIGWFLDITHLSFLYATLSCRDQSQWSNLFDSYISYRTSAMGFESTASVVAALRVLADYAGLCLPLFYYAASTTRALPSSPKDFTRFPFVDNRSTSGDGAPTFLRYVSRRFSKDSSYSHINNVRKFFDFIEHSYGDADSADIAGPTFRNPISRELDLPRVKGAKSRKTNKKPFARFVVPHLLSWFYAVETFGIYLQKRGLDIPQHKRILYTDDFGFIPLYFHFGSPYYVDEIPVRLIRPLPGSDYPSLTVLRMLIAAIETGLRLQSIQWLCRRTFDCLNENSRSRDYFLLNVNTDKTNDGFKIPVLPRVREMLLREKFDQESYHVEDKEIFYENRSQTRFDKLVPLFRNVTTHQPFSDNGYTGAWLSALETFHRFFSKIGDVIFVRLARPSNGVRRRTNAGYEYCPLEVKPIYTPHSCRSTFITRRSPFIELDDVARLVGHGDSIVTSHYDYPEFDELSEKLCFADRAVRNEQDPGARVSAGPAFIKAKEHNSALVKSFTKDRETTIKAFGMIGLRRGLEDDPGNASAALALLRASPMSQIIFRETHICPVGEHCPEEVVAEIREPRRCGICPLACRCIDHLPAIVAKQKQLLERIDDSRTAYNRLLERKTECSELGEIYDAKEADFQEYLGWRLSEEILEDMRHKLGPASEHFHVAQPDIVRRHLTRVVKASSQQEFVLHRIVEANEYPTLATKGLRLHALMLKRRFLAGRVGIKQLDADDDGEDEIAGLASLISTVLRSKKLNLAQLAERVERPLPARRNRRLLLSREET